MQFRTKLVAVGYATMTSTHMDFVWALWLVHTVGDSSNSVPLEVLSIARHPFDVRAVWSSAETLRGFCL